MVNFDRELEKIDRMIEKGNKPSFAEAEIKAENLKKQIQDAPCLEKESRIARIEVILGTAQAFLGKFDKGRKNLESALQRHLKFDALNLCEAFNALTMLDIAKKQINVLDCAKAIISDFRSFQKTVRAEFGEQ